MVKWYFRNWSLKYGEAPALLKSKVEKKALSTKEKVRRCRRNSGNSSSQTHRSSFFHDDVGQTTLLSVFAIFVNHFVRDETFFFNWINLLAHFPKILQESLVIRRSRLRRVSPAANSISPSVVAHHSVSVEQESSHPHGLIDQPTRGFSWGSFAADFHRFSRENWTTSHPHAGEVNFNLLQSKLFDSLIGVLG